VFEHTDDLASGKLIDSVTDRTPESERQVGTSPRSPAKCAGSARLNAAHNDAPPNALPRTQRLSG
jgi:hypothetical protein